MNISNSVFQELTGYAEKELIGKHSLSFVHPEDREIVKRKAIKNLKGQSLLPYEYRLARKDGEIILGLEKVTSTEYRGRTATVGSFMDITERKQAEELLYREKAYTESVVSSMPDMLVIIGADRKITYINEAFSRFVGVQAKDVVGTVMELLIAELNFLTPESAAIVVERVKKRLQTGEAITGLELEIRNSRGETVPVAYSASGSM